MALKVIIKGEPVEVPREIAAAGGEKLDKWIREKGGSAPPNPKASAQKKEGES